MIKCYLPDLFPEGSGQFEEAVSIGTRTYELSDFLVSELGVTDTGAHFARTVTYHDSCHQLRELGISEQPRTLIRSVQGVNFVEMTGSSRCCGFGGTFSVKFSDVSAELGRDKLKWIEEARAEYVIGNDVSCLMHLDGLLKRRGIPVETMHIAELLVK
jgi:L-lactate dehydrogenase complex protein LldE